MGETSEICRFYDGRNIFITGGTGFMGKILIEKLLRSTEAATIYVLIRGKKGKDIHSRLDEIFDSVVSPLKLPHFTHSLFVVFVKKNSVITMRCF